MTLDERRNFIPLCLWRVSVDHVDSSTFSERTPCHYHLISRFFTLNLCKNSHPISSGDSQRISCSYICLYSCITLFYECAGTQLLTNLRITTVYHRIETACYIELPSQFQCGKKSVLFVTMTSWYFVNVSEYNCLQNSTHFSLTRL
jgi:hypothetical protein